MYVCLCNAITDRDFRAQVAVEYSTVSTVYRSLGTEPRCGKCVPYVKQLLRQMVEVSEPRPLSAVTG
jgi:bacterioferritin-associated ferredoxin